MGMTWKNPASSIPLSLFFYWISDMGLILIFIYTFISKCLGIRRCSFGVRENNTFFWIFTSKTQVPIQHCSRWCEKIEASCLLERLKQTACLGLKGRLTAGHWATWDMSLLSCIPGWMGQSWSKSCLHTITTEMSHQMTTLSVGRGEKQSQDFLLLKWESTLSFRMTSRWVIYSSLPMIGNTHTNFKWLNRT